MQKPLPPAFGGREDPAGGVEDAEPAIGPCLGQRGAQVRGVQAVAVRGAPDALVRRSDRRHVGEQRIEANQPSLDRRPRGLHRVRRQGVRDPERSRARPPEPLEVRPASEQLAEIMRQRADVEPGAADDPQSDKRPRVERQGSSFDGRESRVEGRGSRVVREQLELADGDRYRLQFDRLVSARLLVRAHAVDFLRREGWRQLRERAEEFGEDRSNLISRDHPRSAILDRRRVKTLRVVCRRRDTQADVREVFLLVGHQESREARGVPDQEDEEAGGEWIQRAGVTDPRRLQRPPRERDDVVGCRSRRLVDEKSAMHHGRDWTPTAMASASSFRMPSRTAGSGPLTLNPAAFLWPPPPCRAATVRTSTSYSERMLTWMSPSAPSLKTTTAWISRAVSGRLMRPSVSL